MILDIKPLFIAIEGLDGSGTSTQSQLLYKYFLDHDEQAHLTSEPSNGVIGQIIRKVQQKNIIFTDSEKHLDRQLAYLYAADRFDHLFNQEDAVIKKLNAGYHVICTRYVFSSLAYNCTSDDDLRVVSGLNKEFPDPDILIFIVNHVDDSMERIRKRETIEIYENQERLQRVRENYFKAIDNYHGEVIYVDGQNSIQQIHLDIIENIEKIRNEES